MTISHSQSCLAFIMSDSNYLMTYKKQKEQDIFILVENKN